MHWSFPDDVPLIARFARRLDRRVALFQLRYEAASSWSRFAKARSRSDGGEAVVPTALYLETSSFCPGRCRGCYVPVQDRKRHVQLDDRAIDDVIATARRMRPEYVCIVGGEPLQEPIVQTHLAMIRAAPDLRFLICTGGHGHYERRLMHALADLPNLAVFFSVDGLETANDSRRGRGTYARTVAAMREYAGARGVICGVSVTLRRDNWEEATSRSFVRALEGVGANVFSYDVSYEEAVCGSGNVSLDRVTDRLRVLAGDGTSPLFLNPLGRILRHGATAGGGMTAASIDYHGNVYGSRRGASRGNLRDASLEAILRGAAFQRGWREVDAGVRYCEDDPRAAVFGA